jgi:very-short-patch-repair endonuclease
MTVAENKLWIHLKNKQIQGIQFYRQKPIGAYIVDFFAPVCMLVIEVDGSQHFEPENIKDDKERDRYLESLGIWVLRFDNNQVLTEIEAVIEQIWILTEKRLKIPPTPFYKGGVKNIRN